MRKVSAIAAMVWPPRMAASICLRRSCWQTVQALGIFNHSLFPIGGVGFRGKDNLELLLQQFVITPSVK